MIEDLLMTNWEIFVGPVFHLAIFALAGHAPPESCNAIEGWETMLQDRDPAIIVIGEMHGNAESPAIFADAVCRSAIAVIGIVIAT